MPSRSLHAVARAAAIFGLYLFATLPVFGHGDDGKRADAGPVVAAAPIERLVGTVDEILIDDRVSHTVGHYRELRLADGSSLALQGDLTETLKPGARVELSGRRGGRPFEVEGVRLLGAASPLSAGTSDVEVEGTLAIAHVDDFVRGKGDFIYEVVEDAGQRRRLDVASLPSSLRWGMRISINGRFTLDGGTLRPSRIAILAPGPADNVGKRAGITEKAVNNVLVILASFSDTAIPSYTQAQAQHVMTTNSSSVTNFYGEVSFGGQTLNVTVTNWVTMNLARPSSCGTSNWQAIGTAASSAAAAANSAWNASNYGFVVYLFPQVPSCGWNGLAYIGSPRRSWINGTNSFVTQVVTHEMGHNFGLLHAGSLDCGSAPIGGACSVSEYGDPFDTMGNQRAMHFNAQQKRKLNWIASSTVPTHTTGTATYSLTPIESPGGGTYAVRIPAASNRTYWVEFRQPIGFDSPLASYPNNGAQIRVASPFEQICSSCDTLSNDTQMLDMTPGTATFTDGTLLAGQSYTDATYGITINVLGATASALTVQVSTGGGGTTPAPTTTALSSAPNPSTVGATVTFTATVTGSAPTGTVAFSADGSGIAGCGAITLAGSGNSRTAACATSALTSGGHNIVASYGGDQANAGSTSNTLFHNVGQVASTTGIASSANPSQLGSSVTFTATVSGTAPTGSVAFSDNGSAIAGCGGVGLGGSGNVRTAGCTTSGLGAGTRSIVASYSGDGANTGSSSPALSQVVNGASPPPDGSVNVALASNGAIASASSVHSPGFPVAAVNDGDKTGANWGFFGGWNDATVNAFPDWVQIDFNGARTIDRIVLYTLTDNYGQPVEPGDTSTFTQFGIVDFNVQAWNGAGWVTVANVAGNNLVKRTVTFSSVTTDRIRVNVHNALGGYARVVELEAWGSGSSTAPTNVALASNGGFASGSSTHSPGYPVAAINDNVRAGATWGNGGGWNDATVNVFPDWVQIDFSGARTIDRIVLYTLPDEYWMSVEPVDGQTFTQFGIVDFNVQAWNGSSWVTIATVNGNNQIRRTVTFPAMTTDRIRVNVANALGGYARVVELEAWATSGGSSNVALASAGGAASGSSTHSPGFPPGAIIDNNRAGATWGGGGGWNDASPNAFPDWAQVNLAGTRIVDRVVLYTLQDNYGSPVEPDDAQTFTQWGITDFNVQIWNGAAWITVASVSGNNLVKRTVSFPPVATDRVRVNVDGALGGYSRIVELQVWGQ